MRRIIFFHIAPRRELPNVIPDSRIGDAFVNGINNLQAVIVGKVNCWHRLQLMLLY